ncbi:unnamed protein product [Adineta steineri]|uniref:Ubiquitin carboxyl-terminal hydrolase 36 n=1 Tax=Adineta steineri TaxID=433720 RepID=A0A813ZLW3_9BILA|nr:unnamed protein product [Adineta steineri]
MDRMNIRTIHSATHNSHLHLHDQQVQNRAAALLAACEEVEDLNQFSNIRVLAHLHSISVEQVKNDLYGDRIEIKKRFGIKSSLNLEKALEKCMQEINEGVNPALAAVVHGVPFKLIRDVENNPNIKEVMNGFLCDLYERYENEKENATRSDSNIDFTNVCSTQNVSPQSALNSMENRIYIPHSDGNENSNIYSPSNVFKENDSIKRNLDSSDIEPEGINKPLPKRSKKCSHKLIHSQKYQLKMDWRIVHVHGTGLINRNSGKICLNICYINSIIQCLANTAPFVQWLLANDIHDTCEITADNQFCSVCDLRLIIMNIHPTIMNKCVLFSQLSQSSAVQLARKIPQLSVNFVVGRQEDPSEFITFLFDHLMNCLSSVNIPLFSTYLSNPLQYIFGINLKSEINCMNCSNKTSQENYEAIWSIPIVSHTNLEAALIAFCKPQQLANEDSFDCLKCKAHVSASQSLKLNQTSPIIIIHLKRFIYDTQAQTIRKIKNFISYPELLDIHPYIHKDMLQLDNENYKFTDFIYQLYAVLVHLGETANNGHIFSYVQAPDTRWYKANDESVTPVNLDSVLAENNSYMLFYTRVTEENINLLQSTDIASNTRSTSPLASSTPVNANSLIRTNMDGYSPISKNVMCNTFDSNHELNRQFLTRKKLIFNTSSSSYQKDSSSVQSPVQENLSSLRAELFPQNNSVPVELQTESRIEIIPNTNRSKNINTLNTSHSPSSFSSPESIQTPYAKKTNVSIRNDSNRSSFNATRLSKNSNTDIVTQLNNTSKNTDDERDLHVELPTHYSFKVQLVDLEKLKSIRITNNQKKHDRLLETMGLSILASTQSQRKKIVLSKQSQAASDAIEIFSKTSDLSSDTSEYEEKESRVDMTYFYLLLPYIERFNKYCSLCVRNKTFGTTEYDRNQLLRCQLYCKGRPTCPFTCSVIVFNNGTADILVHNGTIHHLHGIKLSRPMRKPIRSLLKKRFTQGASVYRVHKERLQKRTREQKMANNYDTTGKTRNIIAKIKSEGVSESLLAPDVDQAISKLYKRFKDKVNPDGKITGAIQQVSKYPCQIIVYTESSIRLFDALMKQENVVLSWDATGGIIQEKLNSPRLLYYELSITLPGVVKEDSIVPVTFMISDAHGLVHIIAWIELFKNAYSQIFFEKPFPRPRFILSDRAQVFLIGALRVWNNETLKDFLNRAYRIVTSNSTNHDNELTNIHACLAHVLKDTRKNINKYIEKKYRELAMWSIALLINTGTWVEFQNNWRLVCYVFLQLHLGEENLNQEYQDALLQKITQIKTDSNTLDAMKSSDSIQDVNTKESSDFDEYEFCSDDDEDFHVIETHKGSSKSSRKKRIVNEEEEANTTESPFKIVVNQIFQDVLTDTGIHVEEVFGISSRGILQWFKYLTKFFMPTLPIWSTLLLGDLTRHRRRIIQSFERMRNTHPEQQTTAISERRMGILKRTQLGGHVFIRLDIVLSIIVPDMMTIIDEFSNSLYGFCTKPHNALDNNQPITIDDHRFKPIEEQWRKTKNKRGRGYYSKGPEEPIFTNIVSSLLIARDNVNMDLKLPSLTPDWLNIAVGLILSAGITTSIHRSNQLLSLSEASPLIDAILTFIDEWFQSSNNNNNVRSTTINVSSTLDEFGNLAECSTFILEHILTPLLPCNLIVNKVYTCKACEIVVRRRSVVKSILVNVLQTGLHLEHDLYRFFAPTTSDLLCVLCNQATVRHIEVVEWPRILIININDFYRKVKFRKPPGVLSLDQFSSWRAIGCPSSCILIFERVHDQNNLNFIFAIIKCASDTFYVLSDNIPSCSTFQEACSIIEKNHTFHELKKILVTTIKTFFYCPHCNTTPNSLRSLSSQIFIFNSSSNEQLISYPVVANVDDTENAANVHCSHCNHKTENIEMRTFVKPPVQVQKVFDSYLNLNDIENVQYYYPATAVLIISRYSDNIVVVKKEANTYFQYTGDTYSDRISISYNKLCDHFDTSAEVSLNPWDKSMG